jgi:hypothetical protein
MSDWTPLTSLTGSILTVTDRYVLPHVKGARVLRRLFLRHALHTWAAAARALAETKQEDWEADAMDYK